MRNIVYFVGAGLPKALELPQKPIPMMYDFVSVLADYLWDDVILTFLARLEQMEPCPYRRESPQAKELSKRLLGNAPDRSPENLEAFKQALKNRPLESIESLLESVQSSRDPEAVIRFGYAINRLFGIICWDVSWLSLEAFISRQFQLQETFHTFISFNYDLLLERAVEKLASDEWEVSRGYGFTVNYGIMDDFSGPPSVQAVDLPARSTRLGRIEILKPHGSLNWLVPLKTPYTPDDSTGMRFEDGPIIIPVTSEVELRYSRFTPAFNRVDLPRRRLPCDVLPCIVPPVSRKSSKLSFFEEVRKREQEAITAADEIYVLGWSMPKTDQDQELLIRSAVANRSISAPAVTVVNQGAKPEYFERVATLFGADKNRLRIFNDGFGNSVAEVYQV